MKVFTQLICPVSPERVDENQVRVTALSVVFIMGDYVLTGALILPAVLAVDFFIRACARLNYSPLSFLAHRIVRLIGSEAIPIDKAPKIFAARIGFIFSILTLLGGIMNLTFLSFISGSVLILFAFLECGLNFCAGCGVYSGVVFPLVRKNKS